MTWLAEWIVQEIWESLGEIAHRKWGWIGFATVLIAPFAIGGLVLWLLLR